MSDFFTRLAERTLGLAPTIQPIMPSLFASESDFPGDMLLEITEEREESEESVVADNLSRNAESPVLAQVAATHLTLPTQPTQLTHSASVPVQYEVSQPIPTTSSATALRQQPALTTMTERQSTRMQDRLITRNETTTAQTLRMARRGGEINETTATFLASSAIDDPFTHVTDVSMVSATSEQQMAEAQRTTRTAMPHEQIVSHHTLLGVHASNPLSTTGFPQAQLTQQTQPAQLETPPLEPAIQVTIGRVEVRAVTVPPTSAHKQQQSDRPPAMSLDEYLRQQERGGRR
jgi:hypothetical protein